MNGSGLKKPELSVQLNQRSHNDFFNLQFDQGLSRYLSSDFVVSIAPC